MGTYAAELTTVLKLVFVGKLEAKAFCESVSKLDDDKFVNNASDWLDVSFVKSFEDMTELSGKPFT